MARDPVSVVLTCGWPASGKTTTAGRIHDTGGGTLVRSCDVYQSLGISLPDWVRRTRGFTVDAAGYLCERDRAYDVMATLLEDSLARGADLVVVDAVHGERMKRERVYGVCAAQGAQPVLVWCRCDDEGETRRRFAARRGRDTEPEHEASDLSVHDHIVSLWEDPAADPAVLAGVVPVVVHDTVRSTLTPIAGTAPPAPGLWSLLATALVRTRAAP